MAGEDSDNQASSPSSAGFNTDQLPFSTSQNSENFSDEEAEVDPQIIRDEPEEPEEEEEDGEDLFNDNFLQYARLSLTQSFVLVF